MGVKVEFNQELTLRANGTEGRLEQECLPQKLYENSVYDFLKEGQRVYSLLTDIDLHQTLGNQNVSEPLANIRIINLDYHLRDGAVWTRGAYRVNKVYSSKEGSNLEENLR